MKALNLLLSLPTKYCEQGYISGLQGIYISIDDFYQHYMSCLDICINFILDIDTICVMNIYSWHNETVVVIFKYYNIINITMDKSKATYIDYICFWMESND